MVNEIFDWWFGTMEFYDFPYIGNFIIPADELIFFRGVETINQISFLDLGGCWCPKFRRPLRNDPETSFAQGELWCERWGAQQGVTGFWFGSMDWFRGNLQENPLFNGKNHGFL